MTWSEDEMSPSKEALPLISELNSATGRIGIFEPLVHKMRP